MLSRSSGGGETWYFAKLTEVHNHRACHMQWPSLTKMQNQGIQEPVSHQVTQEVAIPAEVKFSKFPNVLHMLICTLGWPFSRSEISWILTSPPDCELHTLYFAFWKTSTTSSITPKYPLKKTRAELSRLCFSFVQNGGSSYWLNPNRYCTLILCKGIVRSRVRYSIMFRFPCGLGDWLAPFWTNTYKRGPFLGTVCRIG